MTESRIHLSFTTLDMLRIASVLGPHTPYGLLGESIELNYNLDPTQAKTMYSALQNFVNAVNYQMSQDPMSGLKYLATVKRALTAMNKIEGWTQDLDSDIRTVETKPKLNWP